jgi:hypothetical protein
LDPPLSRPPAALRINRQEDCMTRLTTLACVAFCLLANSAAAQLPPPPQYPRLEMSVGLTSMSPGPGTGTEDALTAMGLHGGYASSMTQSDIQGFWKIEIGTSERRSLGILKTRVANRTSGSAEIPGVGYAQVSAAHTVVTRAVTWSYRPNGWISVGAGPAVHVRRFAIRGTGPAVGVQSKRSPGAVAGVNLKWKRDGGGFAHALWQYRYAGSLTARDVDVPVYGRSADQHVKWLSTRIPFSHRMIGIGFGVEF